MKPSEQSGGFRFFDNLERYRMCSCRITCVYSNSRKSVRQPFGRNGFNLEKHVYKKRYQQEV